MGESDESNPYGDPTGLQRDLMEQLRRAKERANRLIENEPWSPEEEAELQSELAKIYFDDDFYPPDFNPMTVVIDGEEVVLPDFNSFPMKLMVIDELRSNENHPQEDTIENVIYQNAPKRRYYEIAEQLQQTFPNLYKRTVQLYKAAHKREAAPDLRPGEDQVKYIYAKAYTAAARIGRGLDPGYDLAYLYK